MTTRKGQTLIQAIVVVLALLSLVAALLVASGDIDFSTALGQTDCPQDEKITQQFGNYSSKNATIEAATQKWNASYADKLWEEHDFRVENGEVLYDVCVR